MRWRTTLLTCESARRHRWNPCGQDKQEALGSEVLLLRCPPLEWAANFMDPDRHLWEGRGQSGTRPLRTPRETASVRERTPSFSSTAARWYLTVCVVIHKSAAISLLLKPRATSSSTSSSRAVSAPPVCATAPGAAVETTRSL